MLVFSGVMEKNNHPFFLLALQAEQVKVVIESTFYPIPCLTPDHAMVLRELPETAWPVMGRQVCPLRKLIRTRHKQLGRSLGMVESFLIKWLSRVQLAAVYYSKSEIFDHRNIDSIGHRSFRFIAALSGSV